MLRLEEEDIYTGIATSGSGGGGGGGSSTKYGASVDSFLGDVDANGVLQAPNRETNLTFTGVEDVAEKAMQYRFYGVSNVTSVSFPNLTTLSNSAALMHAFEASSVTSASFPNLLDISGGNALYFAFSHCENLQNVSFPKLEIIDTNASYALNEAFYDTAITSLSFPELTEIKGTYALDFMCQDCSSLTSVSFPKLKSITKAYAMRGAFTNTKLTSVEFTSLETVQTNNVFGYCFQTTTTLTSLSFPALKNNFGSSKNQFNNMLYGITGCTVHFPSNLQSVIGSWSDVTAGFGGTNTTVLFDLPAAE